MNFVLLSPKHRINKLIVASRKTTQTVKSYQIYNFAKFFQFLIFPKKAHKITDPTGTTKNLYGT